MCKDCRHQSTITAGTIFDKTRTPLRVWLAAAWYLTNQKHGVSALGLQRVLGLGSYQTAWTMLHRYRRAMVRAGRERLKGLVEIDEAYIAITDRENPISAVGRKSNTHKVMIGIAVEILQPNGFGRIRLRKLPSDSKESVRQFIRDSIEPDSIVRTDGSGSYAKLHELGYNHERNVMYGSGTPAHVSMAGVHRVAALLGRSVQRVFDQLVLLIPDTGAVGRAELRHRLAAVVQRLELGLLLFSLAFARRRRRDRVGLLGERDELLHERPKLFRLRQRGDDLLVCDERAAQVAEQTSPVCGVAVQVTTAVTVAHF